MPGWNRAADRKTRADRDVPAIGLRFRCDTRDTSTRACRLTGDRRCSGWRLPAFCVGGRADRERSENLPPRPGSGEPLSAAPVASLRKLQTVYIGLEIGGFVNASNPHASLA